jgi:hypothetical protein
MQSVLKFVSGVLFGYYPDNKAELTGCTVSDPEKILSDLYIGITNSTDLDFERARIATR